MFRFNLPNFLLFYTAVNTATLPSLFTSAIGPELPELVEDIRYSAWKELGDGLGGEDLGDSEGYSVASSAEGTIVAIGAPEHNRRSGRVRVYEYREVDNRWRKVGGDILGEFGDESGFSVALSITGDFLAVGSPKCSNMGKTGGDNPVDIIIKETGCVRIYERLSELGESGEELWEQMGSTLYGQQAFDNFGYSVAINDIYTDENNEDLDLLQVAIGAPGAKNAIQQIVGRVYMKQLIVDEGDSDWQDASRNSVDGGDYVGEGTDGSGFGTSVDMDIDNKLIVVGAPKTAAPDGGSSTLQNAGAIYFFERITEFNGNRRWSRVDDVTQYGDDEDDECGTSVSMTLRGSYIAFGCPYASVYNDSGRRVTKAGLVEIWRVEKVGNEWEKEYASTDDLYGSNAGDYFGFSVDIGEDVEFDVTNIFLAVGSPNSYPTTAKPKAGHVTVFHLKNGIFYRANLDIDGWNAFDEFGTSVAVSYDGHRVIGGGPGQSGYAKVYDLKYTDAPTMAPTFYPTMEGNSNPTGKRPSNHKMDDLIYDRRQRSASPFLITLLFLVLIPATGFLAFRGYLYWRARHDYNSEFGSDVRVASANDLELTPSGVGSATTGLNSAPARDII